MKDNRGFSLVELIVVIAIMALVLTIAGISITAVASQRVSNAASDVKSAMSIAETYAKTKADCYMEFSTDSDGSSGYKIYTVDSEGNKKLGSSAESYNKAISIKIYFKNISEPVTVTESTPVEIHFDRTTGGFATSKVNGVDYGVPTKIEFTNGTKSVRLALATYTGLVTYD